MSAACLTPDCPGDPTATRTGAAKGRCARCYRWASRHPGMEPTAERKRGVIPGELVTVYTPKGLRDRAGAAAKAEGISASKWWCRAAERSIGSRPTGEST